MQIPFVKMHGIGNDFVMVDALEPGGADLANLAKTHAVALCDRRFGVGADGVIVVLPAPAASADFQMTKYNPDGSEAEMCGNGIRCFAKFVTDRKYTHAETLRVLTGRGLLTTKSRVVDGCTESVQVDMGEPILARSEIPVALHGHPQEPVVDVEIEVDGRAWRVTCVSMGNPHCIVFVDDVDNFPLTQIGPKFEHHPLFPKRINTEFIQVLNRAEFKMRVWERGAGETQACGTGACAAVVACALNGLTDRQVVGHLVGGDLQLDWTENGSVLMTGPAAEVFSGVYELGADLRSRS